jgi:predicted MFS family arabinose efflux permease
MNNIGQAFGPMIMGVVYFNFGISSVFYLGAIAGVISSIVLYFSLKK